MDLKGNQEKMGIKSRGNFLVGGCFKRCLNRGERCDICIYFSEFEEKEELNENTKTKRPLKDN